MLALKGVNIKLLNFLQHYATLLTVSFLFKKINEWY